jgi:flagellar motor protein MotB
MKLVGAISTAVLTLTLGVGVPAYAQQEQHDQQKEDKDKPSGETEKKAQQKKPAKEEKSAQQQNKNTKQEEKNAQQQHTQEVKPAKQDEHARSDGTGRIPEDRFRAHFGQEHRFRVSQADYSNRRFQYGGYSFGFVQPWPSNWLYTQDVYVIEIDGVYYLCNANYPGVNITLSVVL